MLLELGWTMSTSHLIIHDADLKYFPSIFLKCLMLLKNPSCLVIGSRTIGKKINNRYKITYYGNKC